MSKTPSIPTIVDKHLGTRLLLLGSLEIIHDQPSPPPPSPNHKQGWMAVSRIFPEFPLYIGWGEGEPQDFSERLHCFMTARKLQKIMSTALLSQGLFSWIVDSATAESFMSENSYVIYLFIFSSFFFCHQNSALGECSLTIIGSQCDWGCESES